MVDNVDFMGNEVALNKYYKVKICEIFHIKRLDCLDIKDYARKDWKKIQNDQELDVLIQASKNEYIDRAEKENEFKKDILQMIHKQADNVENMYTDYRKELDDEMQQFLKWTHDFKQKRRAGNYGDYNEDERKIMDVWKNQILEKEKERDELYVEGQQKHEHIKRDYLDRKVRTTKFTKKLYDISLKKPELWKDIKQAEYALSKGEDIPILDENKQQILLNEMTNDLLDDEILDMGNRIKYERAHELVEKVLEGETENLRKQKEEAALVIAKGMKDAYGNHDRLDNIQADPMNQDSLVNEYMSLIQKQKSQRKVPKQDQSYSEHPDNSENQSDEILSQKHHSRSKGNIYQNTPKRDETIHWYQNGEVQKYTGLPPDPNKLNKSSSRRGNNLRTGANNILNKNESYFSNYEQPQNTSNHNMRNNDYISGF